MIPKEQIETAHTMAAKLLKADAELVTKQHFLGRTCIKTTQRYDRISKDRAEVFPNYGGGNTAPKDFHSFLFIR